MFIFVIIIDCLQLVVFFRFYDLPIILNFYFKNITIKYNQY